MGLKTENESLIGAIAISDLEIHHGKFLIKRGYWPLRFCAKKLLSSQPSKEAGGHQ